MPTISERDEMLPMGMKPPKKFCADCEYADKRGDEKDEWPTRWLCKAPSTQTKFDLVSGKPIAKYCTDMRLGDECGPAGNLWKPVGGSEGPY